MVEQESKLRDAAKIEGQDDEEKYVALLDHVHERERLRQTIVRQFYETGLLYCLNDVEV